MIYEKSENFMEIKLINGLFTVCKIHDQADIQLDSDFVFIGKTDDELSLVCRAENCPASADTAEPGWRLLKITGILDFSLVGILAKITRILADHGVSVFAVSTYNTDYILVKEAQLPAALSALRDGGYSVLAEP